MTYLREFPQVNAVGIVEEDDASFQLISETTDNAMLYLYVERINFSVYKAAVGGEGVCTIQTNHGDVVWIISVDGIKDVHVDWGDAGVKVSDVEAMGLQAVLSGAGTQASVSVGVVVHYDRQ